MEVDDEEGHFGLATVDVLAQLDMLDQHLILPEDVPLYLDLLNAPCGALAAAMERFEAEHARIDFGGRVRALRTMTIAYCDLSAWS